MFVTPIARPVTMPPDTEAMVGAPEDHMPPVGVASSVIVLPTQSVEGPVMAGAAVTVKGNVTNPPAVV